ncbi:MAG: hypothetical protein SWH68_04300 [Thermodesulfobacteriota bacterium]|nr:hypothetical protein [Thermodesulfobacteriota bacterium]
MEVFYNGPGGEVCTDTHTISVECGITITGPEQALTDEIITLYADSGGDNGTCTWTCSPDADIQGTGETATFTASSPGSYWITATYTNDSGAGCSQDYQVDVNCPCAVEIIGENTLPAGETIDLMADGFPEPDSEFYFWTPVDGLTAGANGTASYEAREPGTATIEVQYYANQKCSHDNCFTTRDITAWGMASIHPPCPCINTGTTMASDDFTIVTEPAGFQNQALVTPLTFTTGHPSEDIIVTASTSTGPYADTAETTLTVVNENIKTGMSVDISVPNYIIEPLKTIGLADALDLSITTSFQEFTQCCNFGPGTSTDGDFAVSLSVGAGPYTIVGVPIPPKWKDYVAADLLNASLGGSGDVKITGKYAVCDDITTWGGSGDITAEVELASQVTANVPTVIVVNAKVSGSSDITETLGAQGSDLLITTNWGGLTVTGSVKFIVFGDYKKVKFQVNKTYFEKGGLAPVKIPLPSLNE